METWMTTELVNQFGDKLAFNHGDWYRADTGGTDKSIFPHINYEFANAKGGKSEGHLYMADKIKNSGLWEKFKNSAPLNRGQGDLPAAHSLAGPGHEAPRAEDVVRRIYEAGRKGGANPEKILKLAKEYATALEFDDYGGRRLGFVKTGNNEVHPLP